MPRNKKTEPTGFSGVALADILANGVAIIVIMIVVSLMVHYEREQEKLEQANDISVLLSREIANSLVMNALPTSPPARLHNYTTSPLDRNPTHTTMPILELHDNFARHYYTGAIYNRKEMLRQDNALDHYISSLTPNQLRALRIDIYSINQFYIAMSILKQHNHRPRHWHFLALTKEGMRDSAGASDNPLLKQQVDTNNPGHDQSNLGKLGQYSGLEKIDSADYSLPEDVALAAAVVGQGWSANSSEFAQNFSPSQEYLGIPHSNGKAGAPLKQQQAGQASLPGWQQSNEQRTTTRLFRTATNRAPTHMMGLGELSQKSNITSLIRAYFSLMSERQAQADKGLPAGLDDFDFRRHILERIASLPEKIDPEFRQLLDNLGYWFSSPMYYDDDSLEIKPETTSKLSGQAVILPINKPLKKMLWLRGPDQPPLEALPTFMLAGLEINIHPEVHQRIRVEAAQDAIIMMPLPAVVPDESYRWRVVTMVSPEINDFVIGFVYGAISDNGSLILPVDENGVDIKGLRVASQFKKTAFLGEFRQLLLYGLIALFFVGSILYRYKKT